jgi:hypothetical protein
LLPWSLEDAISATGVVASS